MEQLGVENMHSAFKVMCSLCPKARARVTPRIPAEVLKQFFEHVLQMDALFIKPDQ